MYLTVFGEEKTGFSNEIALRRCFRYQSIIRSINFVFGKPISSCFCSRFPLFNEFGSLEVMIIQGRHLINGMQA